MQTFKFIVACVLTLAALALSACGQSSTESASASLSTAAAQAPPARDVQTIVDPSGSVERPLFEGSLRALADAIRPLPRPVPARGSSRPQPSVHVGVRAIEGDAYSPDGQLAAGTIEAIPGVDALPSATDGDITQAALAIRDQRTAAKAAYARAHATATALADRIGRLRPAVAPCSDVWGAISAAAQSFAAPDRRLIVVSDMATHCAANKAGSLDGARVLIVHICHTAPVCDAQERYWGAALRDRGAVDVEFVRFERMHERIRAYVQEVQP